MEDAARGIIAATCRLSSPEPVNLGTHVEISIFNLVHLIAEEMEYQGEILWDTTKPNGQPRRCLSVDRARDWLGWEAQVNFRDGLAQTIQFYRKNPLPVSENASW